MNRMVQEFEGGKLIFTEPQMPIKCGGAPQKIMYFNSSYLDISHMIDSQRGVLKLILISIKLWLSFSESKNMPKYLMISVIGRE